MRHLSRPMRSAREVFPRCVTGLASAAKRRALAGIKDRIAAAENAYKAFGLFGALHILDKDLVAAPYKDQLIHLYSGRLSKKGSDVREIYDELISAAPGRICPLCGQRVVHTLDHYLEKAAYPEFAVTPVNLVPCCRDCNSARGAHRPANQNDYTLHPYFDDVEGIGWLHARVMEVDPVVVVYRVETPSGWDPLLSSRLQAHFRALELGDLYAAHAAAELAGLRVTLTELFSASGTSGLESHLREQGRSRKAAHSNSWQGALYFALADSQWFCEGGVKCIAKP